MGTRPHAEGGAGEQRRSVSWTTTFDINKQLGSTEDNKKNTGHFSCRHFEVHKLRSIAVRERFELRRRYDAAVASGLFHRNHRNASPAGSALFRHL